MFKLVLRGVDLQARDFAGRTALLLAAEAKTPTPVGRNDFADESAEIGFCLQLSDSSQPDGFIRQATRPPSKQVRPAGIGFS
ncbi:unnamed protein product [Protopolystoma xenopodis]|uniref:Uncharacterized protein n=1 Tax=Protopolystoma xenopodis TaxID=117903 RepID=A0A3S5AAI5_9PLAT|nr:unnamed protein product [Protopolystoma xenopodis]